VISSLSLVNFKCFRLLALDLGMINVLAGMNGSGKSTVIQSLLAVRQSWESASLAQNRIELNGRLVELGTSGEVFCADPTSAAVEIHLGGETRQQPGGPSQIHELGLICPQPDDPESEEHSEDYVLHFIDRLLNNAIMAVIPHREHACAATQGFC